MKTKALKGHPTRRDLMNRGQRVPLTRVESAAGLDDFVYCLHCYCKPCKCEANQERRPRYSPADYQPYQLSEDDLIACIDLFNSLTEEDF